MRKVPEVIIANDPLNCVKVMMIFESALWCNKKDVQLKSFSQMTHETINQRRSWECEHALPPAHARFRDFDRIHNRFHA